MRKMGKPLVVLLVLAVSLSCIIGTASAWGWELISADASGGSKNTFEVDETVYANAKTVKGSLVHLYVVNNNDGWSGGESLVDVSGNIEAVRADAAGYIPITPIWTPGSGDVGDYDIVLDENQNGVLDGDDLVDSIFDVGFSVNVPEFTTIAMPVGAILGLLFFFNHRKRKKE